MCWTVIALGLLFSRLGPLNGVFPEVLSAGVAMLSLSWAGLTRPLTGRAAIARIVLGGCWNDTVKSKYNLAVFVVSGKFKVCSYVSGYGVLILLLKIPIEIN